MDDQDRKLILFDMFGSKYLPPLCILIGAIILGPRLLNAIVESCHILGGKETEDAISVVW